MLYLPKKVYQLDGGSGLFFFFQDETNRMTSVEVYTDEDPPPPHVVTYDSEQDILDVEKRLKSEQATEIYAEDYRINIDENGDIEIRGRIKKQPS